MLAMQYDVHVAPLLGGAGARAQRPHLGCSWVLRSGSHSLRQLECMVIDDAYVKLITGHRKEVELSTSMATDQHRLNLEFLGCSVGQWQRI